MNTISEEFLLPESVSLVPIDSNVCSAKESGTGSNGGSGGDEPPDFYSDYSLDEEEETSSF